MYFVTEISVFFVKTVSRSISAGRSVYFVSEVVSDVPVRFSFETM